VCRQPDTVQPPCADGIVVATFPMPVGTLFDWHTHDDHQLAWAASGVLTVLTEGATWVLPPTRALWIPAGWRHETGVACRATMRTVYIPVGMSPVNWSAPTPIGASPLLAELIGYLGGKLTPQRRRHAEALLTDLLEPVPFTAADIPYPSGPRAGRVARALREDPADQRTLAEWARVVGASERTLARAFLAETRMPFGRWRMLLRLHAAMPLLATGEPVGKVAYQVGYQRPSAFVAAFRRETGLTPAVYFGRF
jgi:AraC-like DNA-binding protein/quercetin dioxygenase-like cupin family protein